MEMREVKKQGEFFVHNGVHFYDVATGPGPTKAVIVDTESLGIKGSDARRYRYGWYYDSANKGLTREYAAAVLQAQHGYILCEHKAYLLNKGALTEKGLEVGFDKAKILFAKTNEMAHNAA